MRRISPEAKEQLKRDEALRLVAYLDFKGVPTIGWGHTRGVRMGDQITERDAVDYLDEDITEAARTIYRNLPAELIENLPAKCFDALVSFVYNVGAQAFVNPKTRRPTDFYRAIMKSLDLVPAQMQRWVWSGGRRAPGLVARRGRESALWGAGLLERERSVAHVRASLGDAPPAAETDDVHGAGATPDEPWPDTAPRQPMGVTGVAFGTGGAGVAGAALLDAAGATRGMSTDSIVLATIGILITIIGAGLIGWAAWRRFRVP